MLPTGYQFFWVLMNLGFFGNLLQLNYLVAGEGGVAVSGGNATAIPENLFYMESYVRLV